MLNIIYVCIQKKRIKLFDLKKDQLAARQLMERDTHPWADEIHRNSEILQR